MISGKTYIIVVVVVIVVLYCIWICIRHFCEGEEGEVEARVSPRELEVGEPHPNNNHDNNDNDNKKKKKKKKAFAIPNVSIAIDIQQPPDNTLRGTCDSYKTPISDDELTKAPARINHLQHQCPAQLQEQQGQRGAGSIETAALPSHMPSSLYSLYHLPPPFPPLPFHPLSDTTATNGKDLNELPLLPAAQPAVAADTTVAQKPRAGSPQDRGGYYSHAGGEGGSHFLLSEEVESMRQHMRVMQFEIEKLKSTS